MTQARHAPAAATLRPCDDVEELPPELLNFSMLMQSKGVSEWKLSRDHLRCAMEILYATLVRAYAGSMSHMIALSPNASENDRFAQALSNVLHERGCRKRQRSRYLCTIKKILGETVTAPYFVSSMKLKAETPAFDRIIGKKYGSDSSSPLIRARLESWITAIRTESRSQTPTSVRAILSFIVNQCLPPLGLCLENWPPTPREVIDARMTADPHLVRKICGEPGTDLARTKANWLRIFLNDIIFTTTDWVPDAFFAKIRVKDPDDVLGDVHRIKSSQLDLLYESCKLNTRDELVFLLFITTGLRIGGVVRIQTKSVADVVEGRYRCRTQGRTREKGGKWACFPLTRRVQELVEHWLQHERPASSSPYLFPGVTREHLHTETIRQSFKRLCLRAGLHGREYHPHALRHTFAHLLLETGNSVDVVAKCLHHSSSQTTEKFYLKESMEEVTGRAAIPWLRDSSNKRDVELPSFLDSAPPGGRELQTAKKQRLNEQLETLNALSLS